MSPFDSRRFALSGLIAISTFLVIPPNVHAEEEEKPRYWNVNEGRGSGDRFALPGARAAREDLEHPLVRGSDSRFDPFTIVVIPDTQYDPEGMFSEQTQWIADNRDNLNIKFVLHEGDVVSDHTNLQQWTWAKNNMGILDGVVPYAIAPGNHDGLFFDRDTIEFNAFFPVREYEDLPSFGGVFEDGKLDNTYHYFSSGGVDWLVLALEFGPRDQVLEWANRVVSGHPDRKVMIVTHTYLYADDTLHGSNPTHRWSPHDHPIAGEEGGANDGVEIWDKLVRKHDNIVFIFNGHVLDDGVGRLVSRGDHGNQVYQMLANYQKTGGGFLRLLELVPEENRAYIKTYSPVSDEYWNDNQNEFEFELSIFDTIPPEALVKFDQNIEDIVVEGLDNKDEYVEVDHYERCIVRNRDKCNFEIRKYVLTDDHGSTLTLGMTHQKRRGSVRIEISDLQYNDRNLIDIGRNSFKTIFNKIFFHQSLKFDGISAATVYMDKRDRTVVSMNENGSRETILEDGLMEFNLRTYELERMMMDLEGLRDAIDEESAVWAEREESYRQYREYIRDALDNGTIDEGGYESLMAWLDTSYLGPAAQEGLRHEIDGLLEEYAVLEDEIYGGLRVDGENGVIIAPIRVRNLSAYPIR